MFRMSALLNIYHAVMRWNSLSGKHIHELSISERKILGWLKKQEIMFSG